MARLPSLFLLFALASVAHASFREFRDISEKDVNKIAEDWEKDDDIEPEDLPPWKRPPPPMPKIEPGKPMDIEAMQAMQDFGKPKMVFATFKSDDRKKNEEISQIYVQSLKNNHVDVKAFQIEDDKILYSVNEGHLIHEVVKFLKTQDEIVQLEMDSKKLLPESTKERKEKKRKEKEEKEKKKNSSKKSRRRRRRRRQTKSKDEL